MTKRRFNTEDFYPHTSILRDKQGRVVSMSDLKDLLQVVLRDEIHRAVEDEVKQYFDSKWNVGNVFDKLS